MGTSSRQPTPTGGEWTRAKTRMTNWVRSNGANDQAVSAALSAFVSALGGASRAAASSTGGIRTAGGLGEFFGDVGRDGLEATLEQYGLEDLIGSDPIEVLNEIASRVAGAGDSPEEAVARKALLDTLGEIYADAETFDDLEALQVDAEAIRDYLARFLTEYVYERVLHELGDRIRDNAASPDEAARLERQMREHIRALVELDLSTIDTLNFGWNTTEGQERLRTLLADAFRMVSAGE